MKITVERLASTIGLIGLCYTIVAFFVELGFFWELGINAMTAFSLSEHILHATALMTSLLGPIVLVAVSLCILVAAFTRGRPAKAAGPRIVSSRTAWIMRFAYSGVAIGLLILAWAMMRDQGFAPSVTFIVTTAFFLLTFVALIGSLSAAGSSTPKSAIERTLTMRRFLLAQGVAMGMAFATGLGSLQFSYLLEYTPAVKIRLKDGEHDGKMVFAGASKVVVQQDGQNCLLSIDGDVAYPLRQPRLLYDEIIGFYTRSSTFDDILDRAMLGSAPVLSKPCPPNDPGLPAPAR
jgi:hypothetical protein